MNPVIMPNGIPRMHLIRSARPGDKPIGDKPSASVPTRIMPKINPNHIIIGSQKTLSKRAQRAHSVSPVRRR